MAGAVSRIFTSKVLETSHLVRSLGSYSSQIAKLSTQTKTKPPISEASELQTSLIDPLKHPDFFGVHTLFTVKDLFDAKVHLGHKEGSLNDHMRPYLFGSRQGHLIIDLDQTAELLRDALNIAAHIAFRDGIILFLTRHPQAVHLVEKTAAECGEFSHARRWRDGTFTNSKKEFRAVTRLPDLCIFITSLDTVLEPHNAIRDAAKMCIPTIGVVDTNCDPCLITYPVPGNDDTPSAIELYCKLFKTAIQRGKAARAKLMNHVE
ncbi:28S ribosomal protein S2, mitochondrial [Venturia canescens]|uniref:28S ribosomal protein S2, mitochondrial n=1 Tax=Venturia canescens TaxID=32260 RepID=UPI001C9C8D44|nr:28S ribosomal protein S2, mitochondrial [Venturia canescens]